MKLDDFLKCKKVRCVKGYDDCLKIGKEYDVIDVSVEIKVKDDEGAFLYWESDYFEPVLADNSINIQDIGTDILDTNADIKDTPRFKVGNKVYVGLTGKIAQVTEIIDDEVVNVANKNNEVRAWVSNICHATPENYERLQATFPHIEFEKPTKELTGSDLCRAIKAKGKKFIICAVSDISEEDAINNYLNGDEEMDVIFEIDDELDHPFIAIWGNLYKFAVPLSEETGEPLTESVLDE